MTITQSLAAAFFGLMAGILFASVLPAHSETLDVSPSELHCPEVVL